jgi:Domain of unknown function(DUF2779)/PD-(D/E)XK nuclease superfamily
MSNDMTGFVDKRAFLAGRLCLTQGWYVYHAPPETPGPGLQWRFHAGADVAWRAREWLGDGRYLPRTPLDAALQGTAEAVKVGESSVLFEASFAWKGLVARADCIRRVNGGWTLIEVKSGKSPDDGCVKEEYLDDIAYTTCVAQNAGLPIVRAELVLINRDYTLDGDAEIFTTLDVTADALARATVFSVDAQEIASAISADQRPEPELRFACKDCDFFETTCIGKDVPDPLFVLPRLSEKRFKELRPYERVSRIPCDVELTEPQQRVADLIRSGRDHAEEIGLRILDNVVWPAHYLDFEAVMPYLPWFQGRPPYDAVPFQYSLHILTDPGALPQHRQYLAPAAGDWRRELTEQLLLDLGTIGSVVVYSSYEKTRLNALAALFPDLRERLERVVARLFDLERVFKNGYSHPGFAGRTSIKNVLPAMVPDLRYDGLEVNNGDDAAGVFALMRVGEYASDAHEALRARLLQYCKLDTTAMVRLHEAVLQIRDRVAVDEPVVPV